MSERTIKIHNLETGDIIERDMTDEEWELHLSERVKLDQRAQDDADRLARKQELLDRLGITEDEAKLLLS
jgi:hypothetical protein